MGLLDTETDKLDSSTAEIEGYSKYRWDGWRLVQLGLLDASTARTGQYRYS
jgi:hypothetical protein